MKFVIKHRTDILRILKQQGIQESDVSFVKKRGRININHLASGRSFSYLRVKKTALDPITKQWVHQEWFKIKSTNTKERDAANWSEVIEAFSQWLASILFSE